MSENQRASFPLWGSLVLVLGVFVMATSIKQQKKEEKPAEIRSPLATTVIPPASAPKEKRKDEEEEGLVIEIPDWSATLPSDEGLSDEKRDAIQHEARAFMDRTKKDDPRRAEFLSRLTTNPNVICGRAHSAAISGALTTENIDPEVIADVVDRASTKCNEAIIESAGFAINVDGKLATALEARTRRSDSSPESKRAAWLAYGSIAETARRHHRHARMAPSPRENEWISAVDSLLEQKLEAAKTPEDKLLFVRAAGNAGCESCRKQLDLHAQSSSSDLRRAAVAAHRFIDDEASQKLMCEALTKDRDDGVRDLAAWSLEWRTSSPEARVQCLTRAAEADPSARVRMQTVLALGILANDHVPLAEEALERLASSASDDRVAHLAASTLSTRNGSKTKTNADLE